MEADFNFDGYDQNDMDSCDLDEMDGCNLDYIDETTMAGNTGQDLNELYKTFSGEDTSDDSNEDPDTDMEDDYNSASYGNTSGPPNVKSLNKKMEPLRSEERGGQS
ncbi:hypothetical protein K491DRAFT_683093 [Lophiostoma macrostomum CBS 122681]|uniref:Uncharacterized protein n=1 Tax=Lophiostoma macrostomum CBS 122681 TaxID=1314788 RepID=A0A6A6SV65_9PLEO|nr:hypothetical protein K491DRAFT_683093 [Lophiostoma macrostomum CBS 122681]